MSQAATVTPTERILLSGIVIALTLGLVWMFYTKERDVAFARGADCPTCTDPNLVIQYPRGPIEFTADFFGMKYKGTSTELIDRYILFYGAFEKPILFFMGDVAATYDAPVTFLDVGANTGQHTMFMSKQVAHVHAVEPYPVVLTRLRDTIELNRLENITVHPVGLGAEAATLKFFEPATNNPGMGSFVEGHNAAGSKEIQLEIVTGDSLFAADPPVKVDIVKMDIEGYEKPALQGLKKTLERDRPVLIIEVTVRDGTEVHFKSMSELRTALPGDYVFFRFDRPRSNALTGEYSLVPYDLDTAAPGTLGYVDVVAVPRERASSLPLTNRQQEAAAPKGP